MWLLVCIPNTILSEKWCFCQSKFFENEIYMYVQWRWLLLPIFAMLCCMTPFTATCVQSISSSARNWKYIHTLFVWCAHITAQSGWSAQFPFLISVAQHFDPFPQPNFQHRWYYIVWRRRIFGSGNRFFRYVFSFSFYFCSSFLSTPPLFSLFLSMDGLCMSVFVLFFFFICRFANWIKF